MGFQNWENQHLPSKQLALKNEKALNLRKNLNI